jgi:hypothetical protein
MFYEMPKFRILTLMSLSLLLFFAGIDYSKAQLASPPNFITYQGRVFGPGRLPLPNGGVRMSFAFWDAETGGNCLWASWDGDIDPPCTLSVGQLIGDVENDISLFNSRFSVNLGDDYETAAFPDDLFANANLYLEISIFGEVMEPRRALSSAPYSLNSGMLQGLRASDFMRLGTGLFTPNMLTDSVSNFAGNYQFTTILTAVDDSDKGEFGIVDATGFDFENPDFNLIRQLFYVNSYRSGFAVPVTFVNNFPDGGSTLIVESAGDVANTLIDVRPNHSSIAILVRQNDGFIELIDNVNTLVPGDDIVFNKNLVDLSRFISSETSCGFDLTDPLCTGSVLQLSYSHYDELGQLNVTGSAGNVLELQHNAMTATGTALFIRSNTLGSVIDAQFNGDNSPADPFKAVYNFSASSSLFDGDFMNWNYAGIGRGLNFQGNIDNFSNPVTPFVEIEAARNDFLMILSNSSTNHAVARGLRINACGDYSEEGCEFISFGTTGGAIETNNAGQVRLTGFGADYAELFPGVLANVQAGEVIGLNSDGTVSKANLNNKLIGAFSTNSIVLGNAQPGWRETGNFVPVGLVGQIEVRVNTEGGPIVAGDPLSLSTTAGVATKSNFPGQILGYALENFNAGTGTIKVYVNPKWSAGDYFAVQENTSVFTNNFSLAQGLATATLVQVDSPLLRFVSSFFDGIQSQSRTISLGSNAVDANNYSLSFFDNNNQSILSLNQSGDIFAKGAIFPGDRGSMQNQRYIYFDGDSGLDGFMRTNADGWGTGSYDFAEMFPSSDQLSAGQLVVFANNKESVGLSPANSYNPGIVGIVSTRPGFLAGENKPGHFPIALVGRVPTFVTSENGNIAIGDALTTSPTRPGYAMKATEDGYIVGYALENFSADEGSIIVFVRPGLYKHNIDQLSELNTNPTEQVSNMIITDIDLISGIHGMWRIDANGNLLTRGSIKQILRSLAGITLETFAVVSNDPIIQFTGAVQLVNGRATVYFDHLDEAIKSIIRGDRYQVFLTPNSPIGNLYVTNKSTTSFDIVEVNGNSSSVIDWMVLAYPYDYQMAPIQTPDMIFDQNDDLLVDEDLPELTSDIEELNAGDENVQITEEEEVSLDEEEQDMQVENSSSDIEEAQD